MVVEAIEECSIAVLWITPEDIERLLVGQSIEVIEGVPHCLGWHCMEQRLKPYGAVYRDHPTACPQITAQRTIVEVMHPTRDAVLPGEQPDQQGIVVVAAIPGMVLKSQMI